MTAKSIVLVLILAVLAACAPVSPPENTSGLHAVTPVPTLDMSSVDSLCQAVDDYWERNWPLAIQALEGLRALDADCGLDTPLVDRLYSAYVTYGGLLEGRNRQDEAIAAYSTALNYNAQGPEAADGLRRLSVYTPPAPPDCASGQATSAQSLVPAYTPTTGDFVAVKEGGLIANGQPFPVYGVVYYPLDTPYERFLTTYDADTINQELDLMHEAGLNTLRIRLRHDVLFTCKSNGAVPVPDAFARLDAFIQAAAGKGFRLILTLNDTPDAVADALYSNPRHTVEQIVYLATRYRNEPALLAWDLREGGDTDYLQGSATQRDVLEWLIETAVLVRRVDTHHLITATWSEDAEATLPAVDFLSFSYFGDVAGLRQRIALLTAATDKPILLSATGTSTYESDERAQADALRQALDAVERNTLAGWLVWTAFDFPLATTCIEPDCPSPDSPEHHFGLWNTSRFPKLAVEVIQMETGAN
ncbi:MAG: cellulase family glycosylhydrolase [Anaerolineaceae bacterium]|nr:cellulase family glycosylhydrolase [Anaerolineaceae bacterium]